VDGNGALRLEMLGALRAWRGDQELDLGPAKQRAVLAVLAVNVNRPVPTVKIVDAVWREDPPENGANVVQKHVAGLRRVLEPERSPRAPGQLLALTESGYLLSVPAERLDTEVFAGLVRSADQAGAEGRLEDAVALLREADALWRAEALAGLAGPVFDAVRERLGESRAAALETRIELELRLGRHDRLVPELVRLVAELPLREHLRELLMLALYRSGRQAEALAAYRDARRYLADEFGVEPGERLQDLHQRILRSDPTLSPPTTTDDVVVPGPVVPVPVAPAPAYPRKERFPWRRVLAFLVATGLPLATFGVGSFAVVAYYAARRRSLALALTAAGYLGLVGVFFAAVELAKDGDPLDVGGMLALVVGMLGGAVHGAVLSQTGRSTDEDLVRAIEQRTRRDQARQLIAAHPEIAVQLGVGRPDLPRTFDDGGLVDINRVPGAMLAKLPGISGEQARRIVADRTRHGPLISPDELVARRLLPERVVVALWDTLVALP
jgi:DNA-binding SARP family transcriptional activator/DNA uptake protein ComE-like DNA-binding protein